MRDLLTILLSFSVIASQFLAMPVAQAYYFATDLETKVIALDEQKIELEVVRHDDKDSQDVYPLGTKLYGKHFAYKKRRHFMRDEYIRFHLAKAVLPNGDVVEMDNDIKLKPRVYFNTHNLGSGLIGATAISLQATLSLISVTLPVARGGKAIWDSTMAVYNTPTEESKLKQGSKAFVKGALFPLPELILKGEQLAIHDESYIWIQDAKEDKKKLTAFVVKRKNQYLDRAKYYKAHDKVAPDFSTIKVN